MDPDQVAELLKEQSDLSVRGLIKLFINHFSSLDDIADKFCCEYCFWD